MNACPKVAYVRLESVGQVLPVESPGPLPQPNASNPKGVNQSTWHKCLLNEDEFFIGVELRWL